MTNAKEEKETEEAMLTRHQREEKSLLDQHFDSVREITERTPDPDMRAGFIATAHSYYNRDVKGLHERHRTERGAFGVVWKDDTAPEALPAEKEQV